MEIKSAPANRQPVPALEHTAGYRVSHFDNDLHSGQEIAQTHLAVRQWQQEVQGVKFSNFYESWDELHTIEERYKQSGGNFFVAQDPATDQVIGHVGIINRGEGVGTLKRMAVLPEHHGRGIGRSLALMALVWTKQHDFSKIMLTTGEIEDAKPFYEKFGFREIGRVLRNHDYLMELILQEADTPA